MISSRLRDNPLMHCARRRGAIVFVAALLLAALGPAHAGFRLEANKRWFGNDNSQGVAVGDLDGDGHPDAVVANVRNQRNRIWLGDGSGIVADSGRSLDTSFAFDIAMADLDGDGDNDVVVANANSGSTVWRNDGDGGFGASPQQSLERARSIALGDIDGDDIPDAVLARRGGGNTVWTGDGDGTFTDSGQSLGSADTKGVALADMDGDGHLDVVFANTNGQGNTVWTNDGDGTFTDTAQSLGTGESEGVALTDLDGDGHPDAAFANSGVGEANTIWMNEGNGNASLTDTGQALGNGSSEDVAFAELDGDARDELAFANSDGPDTVWTHDGSGDFGGSPTHSLGDRRRSRDVALVDLTGDGARDIVTVGFGGNKVWVNDGAGGFADSGQSPGMADSARAEFADVDGDGHPDLVVANTTFSDNTVWLNDGGGDFGAAPVHTMDLDSSHDLAVGDVDGDGSPDIVFAESDSEANTLWTGDGTGDFGATPEQSFGASHSHGIDLADIDGDGDLDAVVANTEGESNTVWINDDGILTDSGQRLGSRRSEDVALVDVNGDDAPDAVFANGSVGTSQPNTVWINDGSGTFSESGQTLGNAQSGAIDAADMDGDGHPDLVFANGDRQSEEADTLWLNDGNGDFGGSPAQSFGNAESRDVVLADIDGDGHRDAVVVNANRFELRDNEVWRNDGSGNLSSSGVAMGDYDFEGVAVADIEGDGDRDMVVLSQSDGGKALWVNDHAGRIRLASGSVTVAEADGSVTLSIERVAGGDGEAAVEATTLGGSAVAPADYTAVSTTETWGDGETGTRGVTIDLTDDSNPESTEDFSVELNNATDPADDGASPDLGDPTVATITVTDTDTESGTSGDNPDDDSGESGGGSGGSSGGGGAGTGLALLLLLAGALRCFRGRLPGPGQETGGASAGVEWRRSTPPPRSDASDYCTRPAK